MELPPINPTRSLGGHRANLNLLSPTTRSPMNNSPKAMYSSPSAQMLHGGAKASNTLAVDGPKFSFMQRSDSVQGLEMNNQLSP